ncbi:MAG: protein kinase [Anaerolineales bacterium]|nr:protein kinase [Anaerolineales bacterium]
MLPKQIGRYVIKAELGRGGMSTVYWAHDPYFERDVAIKLLAERLLERQTFRVRFSREAKTIAALDHPAIVPVYDFGEDAERPFLVMRFMTGGTLADRLKKGPLSVAETARILSRLAPALDEAHAHGIIHRDLKPSNILFDQRNLPFISDFGIVKLTQADTRLTETGGMVGTPAYMSPEQIQGNIDLDGRSDIYTLGILLFEMLTAEHPYRADTPIGAAVKHMFEPISRLLSEHTELPAGTRTIIAKAMSKSRDDRYQTVTAFAAAVEKLAAQHAVLNAAEPAESADQHARRLALIISSSQHDDPVLAQLAQPDSDPYELASVLQDPAVGWFDLVTVVHNETTDTVRRAISHFLSHTQPHDVFLVYVIGHAVFDERSRLYLAARDTDHTLLRATAVPAAFLAEEMDGSAAAQQILVLDCSYSNAAEYHSPGLLVGNAVDTQASFTRHNQNRVIISANNTIQYIWSDSGVIGQPAPSSFTHYFIEGLTTGAADQDHDGRLTLVELYAYVRDRLARATGEQPIQTPRLWPEVNTTPGLQMPMLPLIAPEAHADVTPPGANGSHASAVSPLASPAAVGGQQTPRRPAWWAWLAGILLLGALLAGGRQLWGGTPKEATPTPARLVVHGSLTATAQPAATPAPTATPTRHATASPSASPTPPLSATATAAPSATITPSATPGQTAVALESSSIFAGPDADTAELAIVEIDESVIILGRARFGEWLYVVNESGIIGYVYAPRFDWRGELETLAEVSAPTATAGSSGCSGACPRLQMEIYPLPGGRCAGGTAYRTIFMRGQGGNGAYTYFWNGRRLTGPLNNEGFGFEVSSSPGVSIIGAGRVESGDGQAVEQDLFVSDFSCTGSE